MKVNSKSAKSKPNNIKIINPNKAAVQDDGEKKGYRVPPPPPKPKIKPQREK